MGLVDFECQSNSRPNSCSRMVVTVRQGEKDNVIIMIIIIIIMVIGLCILRYCIINEV